MMVLVSYDVSTVVEGGPARLRRVAKACLNYGQRVQNSVFECNLDPARWTGLKDRLTNTIDPKHDSLRFYYLGSNWQKRIEHIGAKPTINVEEDALIV